MRRISGLVSKKVVVALALVTIMVGAGAWVLAANGGSKTSASAPEKIVISQAPATSIDYRVFDIGKTPYGSWWPIRYSFYGTDMIVTNSTTDGFSSNLFLPARSPQLAYQGLIYTPYRYSIAADDATLVNFSHPEFMPVFGTSSAGETASLDVYFQYLDHPWWNGFWIPTWSSYTGWPGNAWLDRSGADGYDLGTLYNVTMNRAAAQHWLNMPTSADPATWWTANGATYKTNWANWISNEGNVRLDIYCAYEWTYDINGGTMMNLVDNGDGTVTLKIAHIALGYEILMTRWLTEAKISPGMEVYYEGFGMHVAYGDSTSDYNSVATVQYSLHAVKQNTTASGAAWAWEPMYMDYIYKVGHPSKWTPYRTLLYQSWNSGDTLFNTKVPYENTPNFFNLSAGQTLRFELPTGNFWGYKGVGLAETDYDNLAAGDRSAFLAIQDTGKLGLGFWVTGWPMSGQLNLTDMYNPATRTLTITGPHDFRNFYHKPTGILYHGAPWIELWLDKTGPTANAGPDQSGQTTGVPVTFNGALSTDDVRIFNWTWTFNDGTKDVTLYGPAPGYAFPSLGTYVVTLTVTDSVGNTATDTVTIVVDKVPEFPTVLVPIAATLALIVVLKRRRR